jgi:hypothetical protein
MSYNGSAIRRPLALLAAAAAIPACAALSRSQCQVSFPSGRLATTANQCRTFVDDTTGAVNSAWAYDPQCVYPEIPEGGTRSEGKLCVYTHIAQDGRAGASFVVHPERASFIAGILAANPCQATHSREGWYEMKDLPGKGKGLVAKRAIPAGTIIVDEFPYMIGFSSGPPGIAREAGSELLHLALDRLPLSYQETVNALSRTTGGEELEDVFRTNAFGIAIDGMDFSALYPAVAVCHSGPRKSLGEF